MNIVTGYRGEPHVTSQQDRDINIAIFGDESRIVKGIGSEMDATVVSATLVEVSDGTVVCQGCVAEILRGTTESVAIENGSQGMLRTDLIVVRYTKNGGTGIEDMRLAVIKGTPASSNPQTPSYTNGTIADGDSLVDFPLYRVNINGISIDSIELIMEKVSVPNWINELVGADTAIKNKIGSVIMGTTATTLTGAIKELLNRIGTILNTIGNAVLKTDNKSITYAINELFDGIGTTAMGTTATTIKGAISEIRNHDNNQGIFFKNVTLGTFYFENSGAIEKTVSVAGHIPSGYSLQAVIPRNTGTYAAYFYSCAVSGTSIYIQLMRAANYFTSVTSCSPTVTIICKRNL